MNAAPVQCPIDGIPKEKAHSQPLVFAQRKLLQFKLSHGSFPPPGSGRSVAWLARLFRVQEVVSSNLTAPTIFPEDDEEEARTPPQRVFVSNDAL